MPTAVSRTVRHGGRMLLNLPEGFEFSEDVDLKLVRSGDVLTVSPDQPSGDVQELLRRLDAVPKPSCVEPRDISELPEREGL